MTFSQQNIKTNYVTGGTPKSISGKIMLINKCNAEHINHNRSTFKSFQKLK